jgi:hypothetical protein
VRLSDVPVKAPSRYPARALIAAACIAAVSIALAVFAVTRNADAPAFDSIEGKRVWTGGDSQSLYVADAINGDLGARGAIVGEPDARTSSGLLNPAFFDWPAHIRATMASDDPELAVFMVGTNDAASAAFDADAYRAVVADAMDAFEGRTLLWIGVPAMDDASLDANARAANDVFRSEAARRSWVRYIDAWQLTADESTAELLRADDGIHITAEGGRLIARAAIIDVLGG